MIRIVLTFIIVCFGNLLFSQKKFNFELGSSLHSNQILIHRVYDEIDLPKINPVVFVSLYRMLNNYSELGLTFEVFQNKTYIDRKYIHGIQNSISINYRKRIFEKNTYKLKIESSLTSKTLFWNGINISYIYILGLAPLLG
jgi:hypothetical protein